jgi:rod shape-determining protein MreC
VTLSHLSKNAALKSGQAVFTSGMGGVFPHGLRIGTVVDTQQLEYGLSAEARIQLAVKLGPLNEVWVLTEWTR